MAGARYKSLSDRLAANRRRQRVGFAEVVRAANARAHERTNRRLGERQRSMRAAIAATDDFEDDSDQAGWVLRTVRWLIGLALLPVCWVTTVTFLTAASNATMAQKAWQSAPFWYFAIGAGLMAGWFFSGLLRPMFLYLYVLGHELTHALVVLCFLGKVSNLKVGLDGGYITTNKSNWVIALAPYFVPFWSMVVCLIYWILIKALSLPPLADKFLYFGIGASWAFHLLWTLWMIPRDQPDLRENGTFLSLIIIYLANLALMGGMLCAASSRWTLLGLGKMWWQEAIRFVAKVDLWLQWLQG